MVMYIQRLEWVWRKGVKVNGVVEVFVIARLCKGHER